MLLNGSILSIPYTVIKPSGGIQVIAIGKFKQIPPVSNDIDEGQYCFESPLWNIMFPHCI